MEKRPIQATIGEAKANLPRLIDAALAGEDVVISRGSKPVVKLVALPQGRFRIGLLADQLKGPVPDFLAPMEDDELALWEGNSR